MEFPTLYARSSTGAVLTWQLFYENNSFWVVSGQIEGKKVTSSKTYCDGKNIGKANETSPQEQALREAKALFDKKISQGGYFEDINLIDQDTFFSPQLAKGWEEQKSKIDLSKGDFCSSPKLDGVRVIVRKEGCFSRNGKEFVSFPHIHKLFAPIFEENPDFIADGEIYAHQFAADFNKIISLAKQSKPTAKDLADSEELLEYWMFDCGVPDKPFSERLEIIKSVVEKINDHRVKLVEHEVVRSEEEVQNKFAGYMEEGFEGAMIKNLRANYQNKRTKDVLKFKVFQTEEFEIIDITEGTGNRAGKFGRATLRTKEGRLFDANARGNEEFYKELWLNKDEYIGQMATVRFQNWTPGENSCPRFPVVIEIRNYE